MHAAFSIFECSSFDSRCFHWQWCNLGVWKLWSATPNFVAGGKKQEKLGFLKHCSLPPLKKPLSSIRMEKVEICRWKLLYLFELWLLSFLDLPWIKCGHPWRRLSSTQITNSYVRKKQTHERNKSCAQIISFLFEKWNAVQRNCAHFHYILLFVVVLSLAWCLTLSPQEGNFWTLFKTSA